MNLLLHYPKVVFFTGAGMSKESGVPTYRGEGGTWSQYRYQDYACQEAFERNPEGVWDFHELRREVAARCQPHSGHSLIAQFIREREAAGKGPGGGVTVVTQNIDGMHQRSGVSEVFELHGSLWRLRCEACHEVISNHDVPLVDRKHHCGNYFRPDVTWFGDPLNRGLLTRVVNAVSHCHLFVSIGTSGVVFPAARLPLHAIDAGASLIEINPEPTSVSAQYQRHMRGPASDMLRQLFLE